jgi:hypothetical protein
VKRHPPVIHALARLILAGSIWGCELARPEDSVAPPEARSEQPGTTGQALGAIYYVATTGSDSAAGTLAAPWRTVGYGMSRLGPGDTLYVRGGTYNEFINRGVTQGTAASRIRVMNHPGERPVIQGQFRVVRPSYWTFQGINVTRSATNNNPGAALVEMTDGLGWIFRDGEIWGAQSYAGFAVTGGSGVNPGEPGDWRFMNNCVHDTLRAHDFGQDHNLYLLPGRSGGRGYIERNILFGAASGTNIKVGHVRREADGTVCTHNPDDLVIRYNTLYDGIMNVRVVHQSDHIRMRRNLMVRGTLVSGDEQDRRNVEGYCNSGSNSFIENLTWDADRPVGYYSPGGSTPSCPDALTYPVMTAAQNVSTLNPVLSNPTVCSAFQPQAAGARPYGRHAPVEQALAGRWMGGARDMPVTSTETTVFQRNAQTSGPSDNLFDFGIAGDVFLMGDWNGDGVETIGLYRPSANTFYLKNTNTGGSADISLVWGLAGATPLVGDWNGDGIDTVGIVRGNTVYLKNMNSGSTHDLVFTYGSVGDRFIAGDWNGDGIDTVGAIQGNTMSLRNSNSAGPADISFSYGSASHKFVVGDWNGDGIDTLGAVTDNNQWHLRNSNSAGAADVIFNFDT